MNLYKNAVAAIGLGLFAISAQATVVADGFFNNGLTDWHAGTGHESVVAGEALLEGGVEYIYQTLTLSGNTSYVLTFTSGGVGTGWVDFYTTNIPLNGISVPVTFSNSGQHSYNFTTGSGSINSKLEFASVIGNITIDNVSITTSVPEPESWAMLLVGLTAVGGIARRRRAAQYQG